MVDRNLRTILFMSIINIACSQTVGTTEWDIILTNFPKFLPVPLKQTAATSEGWAAIMKCGDDGSPGNLYANTMTIEKNVTEPLDDNKDYSLYNIIETKLINNISYISYAMKTITNDLAAMPFYNADGQISGIILGMKNPGTFAQKPPYVQYTPSNGDSFFGIEANFRDPATICIAGSTANISFGDRLWFANGAHSSYTKVPLTEATKALEDDGWSLGTCKDSVFKMGYHYWRYLETNGDCNDAYPIFILYDDSRLHAFGVAMGNTDRPYLNSTRWEHPTGSSLTSFFLDDEAPKCLAAQNRTFNSQHVYMTSSVIDGVTSCNANTEKPEKEENEALKTGYIVIIILCVLLFVAALLLAIKCCYRHSKRGSGSKNEALIGADDGYRDMGDGL